jgi:hypothetical protein
VLSWLRAQLTFGPASLKRLLTTFDLDRSGQIGVNEFVCLYQFVLALRNSFTTQDHDRSGKLDNCTLPTNARVACTWCCLWWWWWWWWRRRRA